ncbi:hypothetical protein MAR_017332 [Mya arenaria]|uniref:Uncharacterized protein n=1 Tax=Mya arenaria TaxID=6604 RepID=A0ABY7EE43_MYAAR|nr:hypothetical protein MAR_017332 [Mya arenaria]
MVWKIPLDIRDRLVQDVLSQITVYKTRRMHKDFVARYRMFAKPAFEYSPENAAESEIDLRLCEYLLQNEDTELMFDLRKNNGRPLTKEFERFWTELDKFLKEKSVVHERRQTDVNYMPFALSVEDLKDQIKDRLPMDCKIPSVSWLKLNFYPSNPYKSTTSNYTGRFKVKFQVLLRAQHEDSEYCRNQFSFMKAFACKFRNYSVFQSLDDMAIIPVGEPSHAVSTGVRIHHGGLVSASGQTIAMDHDFHIAGVIPSVCFVIDIPPSANDSFYNGLVNVTVKVFEASSPLRHSAENIALVRKQLSKDDVNMEKSILIRYSDGGPGVTYRSVQICSLVEFIALDLDFIVCARTAPSMSYLNPAERTMSVLYLALQNVALKREKMPPEYEIMAKGKTLTGLRNVAQRNSTFKEEYCESTEIPIGILKKKIQEIEMEMR